MSKLRLRPCALLLAVCALPLAAASTAGTPEQLARSVTIYRDNYGVPHVYGPTDASCVFGYAYAQAEDNFWQIEDSYLRSLGRASEVYGESTLNDDLIIRSLEITKLAKAEYEREPANIRALADAFADGLNYYLARHPEVKPRLVAHFEPWHMYAFNRYALYYLFLFGQSGIKNGGIQEVVHREESPVGSNMWAIAPSRSATGHAMLFINPHQPFFGAGQWYEGHVHSDEGWDLSGASFFGSGFPTIGHNQFLGWSHTVNNPDVLDVYEETFDSASDPLAYRYDGGYRKATEWKETIAVKTDSGIVKRVYTLRKTHHGPIVGRNKGKQLAIRFARIEEGGMIDEWYEMGKAKNFAEFKKAMTRTAIPMFNAVYADREGNIFYVYNGAIPRRSEQYDWLKPVDGSVKDTEWNGFLRFDELPQVENPKEGFVQNCNSTPFLTVLESNPDPAKYPKYVVGPGDPDTARARISRRILWNKDKFTFDEWARAAFDTYVIEAETKIPQIVAAWEGLKKADPARAARLQRPVISLREWDHISSVQSKPMTLFTLWLWKTVREQQSDTLATLEASIDELQKSFGTWEVAWGELNRVQRRHTSGGEAFRDDAVSYPVAGAPGDVGIVFNFYARPEKDQKRRYGVAGHSFVSVVEFGPEVKARSILVFGENADPKSPHYLDQTKLYANQQFKPAYFSLADIKAHTERTYHPGDRLGADKAAGGK